MRSSGATTYNEFGVPFQSLPNYYPYYPKNLNESAYVFVQSGNTRHYIPRNKEGNKIILELVKDFPELFEEINDSKTKFNFRDVIRRYNEYFKS